MFKLTRNGGIRRAARGGGNQPSRVHWNGGTPIRAISGFPPGPTKPAFVPPPQEQGYDSNTSRINESV